MHIFSYYIGYDAVFNLVGIFVVVKKQYVRLINATNMQFERKTRVSLVALGHSMWFLSLDLAIPPCNLVRLNKIVILTKETEAQASRK